ncbi:hypothetical protein MVES_000603 [Malassezia vespertilionis]|uniref:Uncharacterized protein n=1 Tax=Malassezia vespertilionis TaxID=2020962 RepID=A0A2N1JH03_9BASI|nr:hypothetical protein MVES_000603 [Malassezia vespertilionis]
MLWRGELGKDALPLLILDALDGYVSPAYIASEPAMHAFDRREVHAQETDDVYGPATLCDAGAAIQAYRDRHGTHWWTQRADMHVSPELWARGAALARAAHDADDPACTVSLHSPTWTTDALAHVLVQNRSDEQCTVYWTLSPNVTHAYLLPFRSAFLLTDLLANNAKHVGMRPTGFDALLAMVHETHGVDVVLMDPPWPNKSAQRAQRGGYATMPDLYDLWHLRPALEPLLAYKPLLGIWITNHPKVHRFVRDKFFPGLGFRPIAAWAWLKLATSGEPLCTLAQPRRRKPFELLLIGVHKDSSERVPAHQLLASVALAHSEKPYIAPALLRAAGRDPKRAV